MRYGIVIERAEGNYSGFVVILRRLRQIRPHSPAPSRLV